MQRSGLLAVMLFWTIMINGQNIQISFTGSGEVNYVDSVRVTNLTTQQMVVLPGNETLILNRSTGIQDLSLNDNEIKIFPNPLEESSVLSVRLRRKGFCQVRIFNSIGQTIYSWDNNLNQGLHKWRIKFDQPGVYFVSFLSDNASKTTKVINQLAIYEDAVIKYLGTEITRMPLKRSASQYSLNATEEDMIHYECYSSQFVTVITDKPISSRNYNVEFVNCTDADSRTYKVIRKGDRWWMAENLNTSSGRQCYDNDVNNCNVYGGLYVWSEALEACPNGWHLPSDEEWINLEIALGMDSTDINKLDDSSRGVGGKIGYHLKSQQSWSPPGSNFSGMNILAAGVYSFSIGYIDLGSRAEFWTSTIGSHNCDIFERYLFPNSDGFFRHQTCWGHFHSVRCIKDER